MANECKLKNLEILRKAHNMTVDELMTKIGKENSRSTYYTWLKTGQIKVCDIKKLHALFNVTSDCILDIVPIKIC
ncbi:MAG: hypothetical protein J5994_10650 [Ruminococcus sp.]|nr:hypothetical protein [Ruminococcus sp.]